MLQLYAFTANFCELFNYSIRSVIISKLLSNDELTINELEIHNVKGVCKTSTAHKRTVNNHLTELRKKGFVKYRRDGLRIYWSLNRDNEVIGKLKLLFSKEDNNHKKKWSKDTDYEIKQYLFGYYDYFEKFKPLILYHNQNQLILLQMLMLNQLQFFYSIKYFPNTSVYKVKPITLAK